jgi:hypothetical protein
MSLRPPAAALLAALLALPAPALAHRPDAPARQGPYSLELVDDTGRVLPTFAHRGRTFVLGSPGQRYLLRIRNRSAHRVEVVASVDGRDVVDGRPAAWEKRGYLVEPWGVATVDGFRLSGSAVAAFRFGSVRDSYAARMGDARDVGVIGVAVFPERAPVPLARPWSPAPSSPPGEKEADAGRDARASGPEPVPSAEGSAAGPGSAAPAEARRAERTRPGLGTEFGERHESWVREVPFERASTHPESVLTIRYDDREGLLAAGVDVDRDRGRHAEVQRRAEADPFRTSGYAEPPPGW